MHEPGLAVLHRDYKPQAPVAARLQDKPPLHHPVVVPFRTCLRTRRRKVAFEPHRRGQEFSPRRSHLAPQPELADGVVAQHDAHMLFAGAVGTPFRHALQGRERRNDRVAHSDLVAFPLAQVVAVESAGGPAAVDTVDGHLDCVLRLPRPHGDLLQVGNRPEDVRDVAGEHDIRGGYRKSVDIADRDCRHWRSRPLPGP